MKVLLTKRYVLGFDSGVIVIKHWRMNNYLQSDRHKETTYLEEKATLMLDEKGSYTEKNKQCIQNVYSLDTQDSIGKDSKDKNNIYITRHKYGQYSNVLLSDEDIEKLKSEIPNYEEYIERVSEYVASSGKKYKNFLATIRNWHRKDAEKNKDTKVSYKGWRN